MSVFVDESGILNESSVSSRFYILTLVLHDQDHAIDKLAAALLTETSNFLIYPLDGVLKKVHNMVTLGKGKDFASWLAASVRQGLCKAGT